MNILGISAFYHDSAAVLVRDGAIIAAAQEERFTRKKHDERFPRRAVDYCLKAGGIGIGAVDYVVFYEKPFLKFERLLETYLAYAPRGFGSFIAAIPVWIKEKLWMKDYLAKELGFSGKILFPEHHESHAASAFYPSPFDDAAILTMDAVGEWATTSYGVGEGNKIKLVAEIKFPHSLGLLYSAFTYYTGFKVNSGEYKLMGLAPYGRPVYADLIKKELVDIKDDGSIWLNMDYFNFAAGLTMTNEKFNKLFGGPPRKSETMPTQKDMDLASSVQCVTEEVVLKMARHVRRETGKKNLCLSGGVALNCVANGKLLREGIFENIWIQPAAGDAGGALGAALLVWHQYLGHQRLSINGQGRSSETTFPYTVIASETKQSRELSRLPRSPEVARNDQKTQVSEQRQCQVLDMMQGAYLGPEFSNDEIKSFLDETGAPYEYLEKDALLNRVADILAEEKVVGWFQGRMEFGPRALGNRSIIGDARSSKMQATMNLKIKFRESFRPFAPSVLIERVSDYFELDKPSPYMLLVADVVKSRRKKMSEEEEKLFGIDKLNIQRSDIPAITHVDYSARVQTVHKETNPLYHGLISRFDEKYGYGVIVNTSFNVRGEPIVCTPKDAYLCFMRTHMDYLVLGNYLLDKTRQGELRSDMDWKKEFELD